MNTLSYCEKYNKNAFFKLSCNCRFQRAITACICVFKIITFVGSNQRNYFENATACNNRMLKTTVATQLYFKYKDLQIDKLRQLH